MINWIKTEYRYRRAIRKINKIISKHSDTKEALISMEYEGGDLKVLLKLIPNTKSKAMYYGFEVDKNEFEDGSSIIHIWDKIL